MYKLLLVSILCSCALPSHSQDANSYEEPSYSGDSFYVEKVNLSSFFNANFSLENFTIDHLNREPNLRIVGGRRARRHEYPFQAILIVGKVHNRDMYFCGGTLINPAWILTAGFCVESVTSVLAFVGVWNETKAFAVGNDTFISYAERTVLHPCYQPEFTGTDLGLVKLINPAIGITPVCLPSSPDQDWRSLSDGEVLRNCVATGFGRTDTNRGAEILQKVHFSNVSNNVCVQAYGNVTSRDKICAFGHNHEDTCGGDGGGPLLCHSIVRTRCGFTYLAGVTIAGSRACGVNKQPGMYSAVFPHIRWIRSIAGDGDPSLHGIGGCNVENVSKLKHDSGISNVSPSPSPSISINP